MKQMMKNKKAIAVLLLVAMLFSIMPTAVFAESNLETTTAYVTIVDKGEIVVAHEAVTVTTGSAIIDDFLCKVHESHGKTYATTMGQYGLSLTTLWGNSSGGFGYWVNDASAWDLSDAVTDNSHIVAWIYQDQNYWSDSYSCFNLDKYIIKDSAWGAYLELELNKAGYDSNGNAIFSAVENAKIIIDGISTSYITDKNGKVGITFPVLPEGTSAQIHIVSVEPLEESIIVPPICEVVVKDILTENDNEKNAQSKTMKKITDVITSLNANTPIVVKTSDNLLTAINNIINDEAFTVVLEQNTNVYDSDSIIT